MKRLKIKEVLIDLYDVMLPNCNEKKIEKLRDVDSDLKIKVAQDALRQIRMNALSSEFIYGKKIDCFSLFSKIIAFLNIFVPLLFLVFLSEMKEESYFREIIKFISPVASIVLLFFSIFAIFFEIDRRKIDYIINRKSNLQIADEAYRLYVKEELVPDWFSRFVIEQDAKDADLIGSVSEAKRQAAYRFATVRLFPGDSSVVCSECGKRPYEDVKAVCGVCGI